MISTSCATPNQLVLRKALMIYGPDRSTGNSGSAGYASVHDVVHTDKGPIIGVGKPASKVALKQMLQDLDPRKKGGVTYMQQNVLSIGESHLIWHVAPQLRQVWFKNAEVGGDRTGTTPHPGLVFSVSPSGWHVFALKGIDRPTPETELFVAPYMNVWANGKICSGNVTKPKGAMRWSTEAWEDAFFRSYFTHVNDANQKRRINFKGGAGCFWKRMLDKPAKRFPQDRLIPQGMTLGDFFARLSQGGL